MDASLTLHQEVMINAGQRGIMVKISPGDIVKSLKPEIADLAA